MTDYQREASLATVQDLPVLAPLPARAKTKKIEIEAAFATSTGVAVLDADGNPDWSWFITENGLNRQFIEAVSPRLADFDGTRLQGMDENGIQYCVNAIADPGIQAMTDPEQAKNGAMLTNDFLAEQIGRHPDRLLGFACVSLHDGDTAASELERCINKLGFKGVLVNGFQQTPDPNKITYLDDPSLNPLWETVTKLNVPLYIHPRVSHQRLMYEGHAELQGATWGFAPETATHLLRLVYSGLFDRFPQAQVAVGHLGETLPYMAWRIEHCYQYNPADKKVKLRLQDYLQQNIWITTSGNFYTPALQCAIETMGADRIMFSVDYPFENMSWASNWIESAPISDVDRQKICFDNAEKFLRL